MNNEEPLNPLKGTLERAKLHHWQNVLVFSSWKVSKW